MAGSGLSPGLPRILGGRQRELFPKKSSLRAWQWPVGSSTTRELSLRPPHKAGGSPSNRLPPASLPSQSLRCNSTHGGPAWYSSVLGPTFALPHIVGTLSCPLDKRWSCPSDPCRGPKTPPSGYFDERLALALREAQHSAVSSLKPPGDSKFVNFVTWSLTGVPGVRPKEACRFGATTSELHRPPPPPTPAATVPEAAAAAAATARIPARLGLLPASSSILGQTRKILFKFAAGRAPCAKLGLRDRPPSQCPHLQSLNWTSKHRFLLELCSETSSLCWEQILNLGRSG